MRMGTIGLALCLVIAATAAGQASTPAAVGDDPVSIATASPTLSGAAQATGDVVIARRGRGADDPAGDDHSGHHGGKAKGGKGRGGHDDGPNHA